MNEDNTPPTTRWVRRLVAVRWAVAALLTIAGGTMLAWAIAMGHVQTVPW